MATAEQIKSLVKAYIDHDDEKFKTVVLQIAAHEAKLGHDKMARDLKTLIDKVGTKRGSIVLACKNQKSKGVLKTFRKVRWKNGKGRYSKRWPACWRRKKIKSSNR